MHLAILRGVIGHHLGHIGERIGLLPIFSLFGDFLAFLPLTKCVLLGDNNVEMTKKTRVKCVLLGDNNIGMTRVKCVLLGDNNVGMTRVKCVLLGDNNVGMTI